MKRAAAGLLFPLLLFLLLPTEGGHAWTFGVCGDSRDDARGIFPRILSTVQDSEMEFLLHLGDLERPGGPGSWEKFRRTADRLTKPLYLVIGDHELRGGTREEFVRFFGLPGTSRSFRHRDAFFVLLDNADGTLPPERLRWLDEELQAHPKGKEGLRFLVVAMHYPPRTDELFPHGTGKEYEKQSAALLPILQHRKVDLLLAAHEHLHHVEDWGGIRILVTGGAGAPMYPFQPFGFYRVRLEEGRVREEFLRIRAEPPRPGPQSGLRRRFAPSLVPCS